MKTPLPKFPHHRGVPEHHFGVKTPLLATLEMKQQQKQREIFVCLRTCFEMTIRPQKSEFKMKYILEIYKYNQTLIKNSFFSYIFEKLLYINN